LKKNLNWYQRPQNFLERTKPFKLLQKIHQEKVTHKKTKTIYDKSQKSALLADYYAHNFILQAFIGDNINRSEITIKFAFFIPILFVFKNIYWEALLVQ